MRYKATVSYDGTNYGGWQSQKNSNSIQTEIEKAISKICNEEIKITGSGRTDKGVHAIGQVFHFDTEKSFKDIKLAINSQLPQDIHIVEVEQVNDDFHARFSAVGKHYDYLINLGEYDPLTRNYMLQLGKELDIEYMKKAAEVFIGEHDFSSFNATSFKEAENQSRNIEKIEILLENKCARLSFYGDGFLRYMVRMLSATLIEAGLHKISIEEIEQMLNAKDKQACHYNVDGCGLYLVEVFY